MKPRAPVRRFDVFAEYNKLEALRDGRPLDEAKGHGLWLAKLVAARRFGASSASGPPPSDRAPGRGVPEEPPEDEKFKSLSGEPQTDQLFDREVVARMGEDFYREVFAPTVKSHFDRGDKYQAIRDVVRRDWKPAR